MISVCHVVGDSKFGGGSRVILTISRGLLRAGYDVHAIATDKAFCDKLIEAGVTVHAVDCIWRQVRPLRDLRGLLDLRAFLKGNSFDIIHTHTSKAGFIGRIAAGTIGASRVLHTIHGFAFHETSPLFTKIFHVFFERLAAHYCDRIVTVSHFHKDWASKLKIADQDSIIAIPNGIPGIKAQNKSETTQLREQLGLGPNDKMALSIGRIVPGKGVDHIIDAMRQIVAGGRKDIHVVVVGDGDLLPSVSREVIAAGIQNFVKFVGFREDVDRFLCAADIVVLPSEREGLSIALLEAMSAGKAIITSKIGSNLEVASGVAEFVDYGDVSSLTDTLLGLVKDPDRCAVLGEKAKRRFEESYTESVMLSSYLQLYREICEDDMT